ncbi:MAG: ornithine cyclodeaminase family protein [Burkholderiaceae bacterium]
MPVNDRRTCRSTLDEDSRVTMNEALFLSEADIESLRIPDLEYVAAVESVLLEQGRGLVRRALKATLTVPSGNYFQTLASALLAHELACNKWIQVTQTSDGRTTIQATILLNSLATGRLLAVIDAARLTELRTAAMTAIAAKALAHPSSESIGFVGCGVQAQGHLRLLAQVFPSLRRVCAFSRSRASAERLCALAASLGLSAAVAADAKSAVAGQDIVVTSVPRAGLSEPFLDGAWLSAGTFCSLVDLGRSWIADTLREIPVVATDDAEQSSELAADGKLALAGPYAFELGELVGRPYTAEPSGPRLFIFGGMAVCDAAAAALCYTKALAASRRPPLGVVP